MIRSALHSILLSKPPSSTLLASSSSSTSSVLSPSRQTLAFLSSSSSLNANNTFQRSSSAKPSSTSSRPVAAGKTSNQDRDSQQQVVSPAERPPKVPADDSVVKRAKSAEGSPSVGGTVDPIVNDMSNTAGSSGVSASGSVEPSPKPSPNTVPPEPSPNVPFTPPSPESLESPTSTSSPDSFPDKPDLSSLPSLDIDPTAASRAIAEPAAEQGEGEGGEGGRTHAKGKPSMSSIERQRQSLTRWALAATLIGGGLGVFYLGSRETPATAKVEVDEKNPISAHFKRFKANFTDLSDYFNKPAFDKLLPDPLPPPNQRPYTLLVDLEDMLVHSTWDRQNGWKTAKRPGVDYFLAYLSQFYEIVLFTTQPLYTALPVAEKLDPLTLYLPYKLARDATRYVKGKIVKDLSYLNRDLSKVILLDTNPEHGALQPENTIIIPKWNGDPRDKGLIDFIPFLESIGIFNPPDVRPIIKAYEGKNIPIEYAKREAERKQIAIEEWEKQHGNSTAAVSASWLSKAFGGLSGTPSSRPTQPMTYLEQKRAEAQRMYKEEQEYWAKNADEIKRLMEEDRQRQLQELKGSLMANWFGGGNKGSQPAHPDSGK